MATMIFEDSLVVIYAFSYAELRFSLIHVNRFRESAIHDGEIASKLNPLPSRLVCSNVVLLFSDITSTTMGLKGDHQNNMPS